MRIASGDTSREVAFVAVDATDFATRETGLSSFTVYRMRDGGTPAAMTTPTITEAILCQHARGLHPIGGRRYDHWCWE
jgi:hypothetical protein